MTQTSCPLAAQVGHLTPVIYLTVNFIFHWSTITSKTYGDDFDAGVHRGQCRVATKHHLDVPRVLDFALLGLRDHFADFQLRWIRFREHGDIGLDCSEI
jgi:hypothetical protein